MKRNLFFNSILVLSFVLSSFGGPMAAQPVAARTGSALNVAAIIEGVGAWLDGLRVIEIEPTATPPAGEFPTATPPIEPAPTLTPTPSFGAPPTETPTPEPTATLEPTLSPTLTPTLEPTSTVTETITPIGETFPVSFTLNLTPTLAAAGDIVTGTWFISGTRGAEGIMELVLSVPVGILPVETGGGTFDWDINVLTLPITNTNGNLSWYVAPEASGPFTFQAQVVMDGQVIYNANFTMPERGPDIIYMEGGEASAFNGHLRVDFPDGALPEAAEVTIRPAFQWEERMGNLPINITAISRVTGEEIHDLGAPVAITVDYGQLGVQVKDEPSLTLFHYDETTSAWIPLLTQVDTENNLLTAWTEQFSPFDLKVQDWEAARLPSLAGFQVPTFTGAANYSFPIQVPLGPGGLQPSLALSYNSQTVDSASSRTQAAWVGMGWSLDTGYIKRNMNGTMSYLGDDTFSLVVNGVGGMLLPIPDQDGDGDVYTVDYQLVDENFWRVRHYLGTGDVRAYLNGNPRNGDTSYWVVWDKNGNQYYFGNYASGSIYAGHAWYPTYPDGCVSNNPNSPYMETWQWSLTRVRNIFGQELTYFYTDEMQSKGDAPCQESMMLAVHPSVIYYSNLRYRVEFVTSTRDDYEAVWAEPLVMVLYMRSRLAEIHIEQDADGNGSFETIVRKYVLGYQDGLVFPGVTWRSVGHTPTLTSITEYGFGGTSALPATSFTYGDGMHLTEAENGYGGRVNFTYEPWHASTSQSDDIADWGEGNWVYPHTHQYYCDDASGTTVNIHLAEVFHPGWTYQFSLSVHTPCNAPNGPNIADINYGIFDGSDYLNATEGETKEVVDPNNQDYLFTAYLSVPADAPQSRFWISNIGQLVLDDYEVRPLVTRWRVVTKTLTDEVTGDSYTYTYSYEGAAVNDATTSQYVLNDLDGSNLRVEPYSEFRGHSHVTETDPDGRVVETWYSQDDVYKGQVSQTQVKDGAGWIYTQSNSNVSFQETATYSPTMPHPEGQPDTFYQDLKILWVYTTSEESRTYNGDAYYVASRNDYQYNIADQGQINQYGNRTRTISSYWNGSGWVAYRGSVTGYYPTVSNGTPENSLYLTGLPGYTNTFQCPGGCDWQTADALSSQWYLYDSQSMFTVPPTNGKLTGERRLIFYNTPPTTDPRYADTSYIYDTWGNRTSVTQYTGNTIYSGYGTGTGARTSTTIYDGYYHTYVIEERNALYPTFPATLYYYSQTKNWALGLPSSMTDPNGAVTSASYDDFGRLLTILRPGDSNPTVVLSYHEASGNFVDNPFWSEAQQRISGSTYFTMRKYYNGLGQLLQTQVVGATIGTTDKDILTDTFYDTGGRVYRQMVPYDVTTGYGYHVRSTSAAYTQTTYDVLGRTSTSRATDGATTSYMYWDGYVYNGVTNVPYLYTKVTNPRGYDTTTQSDIWGRAVYVTPPAGPGVSYAYDAADRLLTAARGGSTTTLTYDFGGRKTEMIDPDMGHWYYAYDALGNLIRQRDAKGQRICLYYDGLNRLTGKHYRSNDSCPGSPTLQVQNTYDQGTNGIGRRTKQDYDLNRDGTMDSHNDWTYDSRGRVTQEVRTLNDGKYFTTLWGYNSADLVSSMTYPSNASGGTSEVVNYTYLRQMLLDTAVGVGTTTYVYNTDYDAAGRVTVRELGASSIIHNHYTYFDWTTQNGQGRLSTILSQKNTTDLQNLSYTYDPVGNVLTIKDYLDMTGQNPQTQTFIYDSLDRLTSGQAQYGTNGTYALQSYTYNSSTGNLASRAGVNYTYGDGNHDHAVTAMGTDSYSYDANGNQQTHTYSGVSYTFGYDQENRLITVTGSATATMYYDGDGNRVKGTAGTTTYYVGNYFEWVSTTSNMKKFYYAGGTRVAVRTGSSTLNFLLGDHLGSTALTTNSSGAKSAEVRYYPWGTTRYTSGTTPTTFLFTGQRRESSFGLYYYGARWYDPAAGRFVQPDTVIPQQQGVQAWDRYAYVNNNPVKYTDPSGHDYCDSPYADPEECEGMEQDKPTGQQPKGGNPGFITDNGPTDLPIEGWSELSREERANSVWSWLYMYQGAHWWTGRIDERQIAAWILFMEGVTLGQADQEHMAQGIRAFIHDNDFRTMLAAMTSFINPDRCTSFTQTDWQLLTNPGEDMTPWLDIVNDVWDAPYDPNWSNYKFWFDASEMEAVNVNEAMLADLGSYITTMDVEGQLFYFTGVNTLAWCATSGSPAYCSP